MAGEREWTGKSGRGAGGHGELRWAPLPVLRDCTVMGAIGGLVRGALFFGVGCAAVFALVALRMGRTRTTTCSAHLERQRRRQAIEAEARQYESEPTEPKEAQDDRNEREQAK